MIVLKFGGTSVANAENISRVISIVNNKIKKDQCIIIVSAMGGVTDALLQCGKVASEGVEE